MLYAFAHGARRNLIGTDIRKEDLEVKYYYDVEPARISGLCQAAEMEFQRLAGPRNVRVDLK